MKQYITPEAINWNAPSSPIYEVIWNQQHQQYWLPEEISVTKDKQDWADLSDEEKEVFKKVFVGLTALDSKQGGESLPLITLHLKDPHAKALLTVFSMFEQIHAKSYSNIFMTLLSNTEIEKLFEWADNNAYLQRKSDVITSQNLKLLTNQVEDSELYLTLVSGVFLESFLFYSGFFYPLYLGGQGKMVASMEMVKLILRDESIHGVTCGLIAQGIYETLSDEDKQYVNAMREHIFQKLMENELSFTKSIYDSIGLTKDVTQFLYYNANKAYMNLGLEPPFADANINPIVENGLNTEAPTNDFFSTKGSAYVKATNIEEISDDTFNFDF